MSNTPTITKGQQQVGAWLNNAKLQEKMLKSLNNNPAKLELFKTSILSIVGSTTYWDDVDPYSIIQSALVAATLDLPINQNLGYAYIVPYKDKDKGKVAQFQMGYKGFIQLAQRTGLYKTISAAVIYEGQLLSYDPLYGAEFDFSAKTSDKVLGYAALIQLINGFEKVLFMSEEEMEAHATAYSQNYRSAKQYKKNNSLWQTNREAMALKTVLKLLISKYGPLSIEVQTALERDQQVPQAGDDWEYADNQPDDVVSLEPEQSPATKRQLKMIENTTSFDALEKLGEEIDVSKQAPEVIEAFDKKATELSNGQV